MAPAARSREQGGGTGLHRSVRSLLLRAPGFGDGNGMALQIRRETEAALSGQFERANPRVDLQDGSRRCDLYQGASDSTSGQQRGAQHATGDAIRCAAGRERAVPLQLLACAHLRAGSEAVATNHIQSGCTAASNAAAEADA